ncbi:unnamed protein product, partial [Rotaria sp. Silwood2]
SSLDSDDIIEPEASIISSKSINVGVASPLPSSYLNDVQQY